MMTNDTIISLEQSEGLNFYEKTSITPMEVSDEEI